MQENARVQDGRMWSESSIQSAFAELPSLCSVKNIGPCLHFFTCSWLHSFLEYDMTDMLHKDQVWNSGWQNLCKRKPSKNFKNCLYQNQLQTFPTDHLILHPCLFPTQESGQTLFGFLFLSSQNQRKKTQKPLLKSFHSSEWQSTKTYSD